MKKLSTLLITVACFALWACGDCWNNDCPPPDLLFFELVDETGNGLLNIPNQKYSFDSLSIISVTEKGANEADIRLNGSNVEVAIELDQKELILKYGSSESDTISFSDIQVHDDKCCGANISAFSASLDGNMLCNPCFSTISIKK